MSEKRKPVSLTGSKDLNEKNDSMMKVKDSELADTLDILGGVSGSANQLQGTSANPFPVECLPKAIQKIVSETNQALGYHTDYIGTALIHAAGLGIGNTHEITLPMGYAKKGLTYMALVGSPGINKSHPVNFALKPFYDLDKKSKRQFDLDLAQYRKQCEEEKGSQEAGENGLRFPRWQRFVVSDITQEALAVVHEQNRRGICLHADELGSWFGNFGRYKGKASSAEQKIWNQNWSFLPINVTRKTGDPIFITDPFISVIGTIQPRLLNELAKDGRADDGFTDRILFAFPDETKAPYWSSKRIDKTTVETWDRVIQKLVSVPFEHWAENNTLPLSFSSDAEKLIRAWQRQQVDERNNCADETEKSIRAKFEDHCPRLAIIVQLLYWACEEGYRNEISAASTTAAIELCRYYLNTALKVAGIVYSTDPLDKLSQQELTIYNTLPQTFKTCEGVDIADTLGVCRRTFHRWIQNKALFTKLRRGEYEKAA